MPDFALHAELDKAARGHNLSSLDLVSIDSLTADDIQLVFRIAKVFKQHVAQGNGNKKTDVLKGTSIFNFFNENSTRTRSSFELAGKHLGSDVINISGGGTSISKGETIGDTARTLDAYDADMLIVRDAASGVPAMLAPLVRAPVLNAGDGWHEHPSQALLDAFTLWEIYGDTPLTTLVVGDTKHSRVFGSQVRLWAKLGYAQRMASWETLRAEEVEKFSIETFDHFDETATKDVDLIYILRLQTERAAGEDVPTGREYSKNFMLNPARLGWAKPDAHFMHPGPVIRDFDVGSGLMDHPRSLIQQQVENGLPVRMALEWLLIHNPAKKPNPWKKA